MTMDAKTAQQALRTAWDEMIGSLQQARNFAMP